MCTQVLHLEAGELKAQKVISGTDLSITASTPTVDYLTVRLQHNNTQIMNRVQQLTSISKIVKKQSDEFIIHYDRQLNPILDQDLLKLLATEKIDYRQITHGQSLEDQLFN
jgi:ABC-2 type transport system ATP-binding protein